jgi:RNA polymerase sigma-70 factor, ECF subfamily
MVLPEQPAGGAASYRPLGDPAMTDSFLLRQFRGGTADAATLLYYRYAQQLYATVRPQLATELAPRVEADDIVQSVFRTFFRRAALGQYAVPAGGDLWKLLLVMALNKIRSVGEFHRAACRDVARTPAALATDIPAAGASSNSEEAAATILRLVIEETLQALPAGQRMIVELRIEGYEVAEIAGRVQRSKRSVERVLRDFRDRLSQSLQEE